MSPHLGFSLSFAPVVKAAAAHWNERERMECARGQIVCRASNNHELIRMCGIGDDKREIFRFSTGAGGIKS